MRTFPDLPVNHPDYPWFIKLLRECGFFIIPQIDHPISALYNARLVGTPTTHGWPEVIDIYELDQILVGHFGMQMYPIRCTVIPNGGVIRIDTGRRCIVCPRWLMR